jgi:hypothetical protein
MLFSLKNTGLRIRSVYTSYWRFDQIEKNVKAYINDIVVMLATPGDLLDDLSETSGNLQKFRMKLNLKKYVFGVSSEKLLGYVVSTPRIDANPRKVDAIDQLHSPRLQK